jgi:hypothetical protein
MVRWFLPTNCKAHLEGIHIDTNETLLGVPGRCPWLASNLQRLRKIVKHSKMLVKFNIIEVQSKDDN